MWDMVGEDSPRQCKLMSYDRGGGSRGFSADIYLFFFIKIKDIPSFKYESLKYSCLRIFQPESNKHNTKRNQKHTAQITKTNERQKI